MTPDERIRECWDTLFVLNHELGLDGVFSLANGASAETLAQAEHDLGFALPEEIRAGCRFSDGVSWPWEGVCFAPAEKLPESIVKYRREVI